MRAVITRGLVGKDRNDEGGIRRLKEAFDEMEYGRNEPAANVTFALGPHAIYTCGRDYLEYVAGLAKEKGLSLNIHCSETQYEYDTCMLGVNPFNQPGVESYKHNMFALLGKPGFEKEHKALLKRL